jgi:hypothetical protein
VVIDLRAILKPGTHLRMHMRGVAVEATMDVEDGRNAVLDSVHEAEELLVPMRGQH